MKHVVEVIKANPEPSKIDSFKREIETKVIIKHLVDNLLSSNIINTSQDLSSLVSDLFEGSTEDIYFILENLVYLKTCDEICLIDKDLGLKLKLEKRRKGNSISNLELVGELE